MKSPFGLFLFLILSVCLAAQDMSFEIMAVNSRPIGKSQLHQALTLNDINPGFPKSWIKEYQSVKISASIDGEIYEAIGPNDLLTEEQKSILKATDWGSNISVEVQHLAKSPMTDEPILKEIKFAYSIGPTLSATYSEGYPQLKEYLKSAVIEKLVDLSDEPIQHAEVRFVIDTNGQVTHARIHESSNNEKVDKLLLYTVHQMSSWIPALSEEGRTVQQEFKLTLGNMVGC